MAPEYRERLPAAALRSRVACVWTGRFAPDGTPFVDRVLPDACVDLVWDGRSLVVAGPDTGPVPIAPSPGTALAGVRFRPGEAPGFLGLPASALRDQRASASEVLGVRSGPLLERLAGATSPEEAGRVLERAVLGWLPRAGPTDPLVAASVACLARSALPTPVRHLAARLGAGERQLHRRCTAAVGYGPKTLHRVLRFRRWLDLAERLPAAGLAELAATAGYADQSHLTRDARQLAGVPPARLLASWRPQA